MSLYLLAVTPLTFYAACAVLRDRPPVMPSDLWRRFALGGLLALPGYLAVGLAAGAAADRFRASYQPAELFVRLTAIEHALPAVTAAAAAVVAGLLAGAWRRRGAPAGPLGVLAAMAGYGSIYAAAELAAATQPPNVMQLLIAPTLRAATLVVLVLAWTQRARPLAAAGIAAMAVLTPGAASWLHAVGAHAPVGVLAGAAAVAGAAALLTMRGRA